MKKLIYASAICVFPVFLLGIVLPLITLMSADKKNFNETVFWIYIFVLAICLAVIMTTVLLLQKYASKIDKLDEEEIKIYDEKKKLNALISKYNDLIAGCVNRQYGQINKL